MIFSSATMGYGDFEVYAGQNDSFSDLEAQIRARFDGIVELSKSQMSFTFGGRYYPIKAKVGSIPNFEDLIIYVSF